MPKKLIDIENLVHWALADQQADVAASVSEHVGLGYSSSRGALATVQELGTYVQEGEVERLIANNCNADAFAVFDAVQALPSEARDLVLFHGKKGTRPDWYPEGAGKRVPRVGRFGKPATIKQSDGKAYPIYDWDGIAPHVVNEARAAYAVWWAALEQLAHNLEKNLDDHNPQPPRAAAKPWE
ncbi:hypothetical protein [Maritalea myrionectae]|uniref:hypothetical protein n=1 Tax=Maritalea myrionectae TaxID=454601 RepID=UPI0004050D9B|nr:hypothetical protein [Maritalea myrionectae]